MIFLVLDILMMILGFPSFFILLNVVLIPHNNIWKFLLVTLVLDVLVLNVYFVNTIFLGIIFGLYKRLGIKKVNLINYLLSLGLLYGAYVIVLGLVNNYSVGYLLNFMASNFIGNGIFYGLSYKLVESNIKLSR